ncbi:uncharacterized protein CLUP02_00900 [Colletotrichum lupini]|uniref:Uncharacterized protein n=2 Tax=Colletotrichum acutatum species complex TaxID=2707335 RepID=A0A9Q8SCZ0_9PEZI|nr:uncharacterized protein CLUP02_00900 [Colletotrichum lupini]XP_060381446.1 uncharacterized protein CTAM01_07970 [Colletotrichum tamarilloi]KAI3542116.1 hypothetical protein CSPX01_07108 [Colletotrichum filicis]KAK1497306.1 hypothetical protein CTAM01_07970 [Colletotrichum tamarilloi]UQC74252.1 hypothetical protein CLUP02_00900 [Colletotrichum lupini]
MASDDVTDKCRLAMAYSLRILLLSIVKDPGQTEALQDASWLSQDDAGGEGVGTLGGSSPQLWKTHSEIYHAVHRQPDMTGSRVGTQRL